MSFLLKCGTHKQPSRHLHVGTGTIKFIRFKRLQEIGGKSIGKKEKREKLKGKEYR